MALHVESNNNYCFGTPVRGEKTNICIFLFLYEQSQSLIDQNQLKLNQLPGKSKADKEKKKAETVLAMQTTANFLRFGKVDFGCKIGR